MAQAPDGERIAERESGLYRVTCPDCRQSRNTLTPEADTQSVRALCAVCWQKRIENSEIYLLAGPDRHHYVCRCGWQTWSRATPMSVRILGLPCFHCGKRWRQSHICPACDRKKGG